MSLRKKLSPIGSYCPVLEEDHSVICRGNRSYYRMVYYISITIPLDSRQFFPFSALILAVR